MDMDSGMVLQSWTELVQKKKKITSYGKIIPHTPMAMLKHEIVLFIIYQPQLWSVEVGEYQFAKGFNLANQNRCMS